MFDRYSINRTTSTAVPYAKTVTVNENRAATDESIRLLMEMRDKAQETLLDSFVINVADMYVVVNTYREPQYQNVSILYKFNINGHEIMDRVTVPEFELMGSRIERIQELTDIVVKETAKKLAESLRALTTLKVVGDLYM